jgi:hypothetical protein
LVKLALLLDVPKKSNSMKNDRTLTLNQGIISQLHIKATLVALFASVAFPFLVHFLPPVQGTPMGAFVLAMFYAPLVAVLVTRFHVALVVAVAAPILNALITGHPHWAIVPVLTIELSLFVTFVFLLNKYNKINWFSAPLAYVAAKSISALLIALFPIILNANPVDFWVNSISNGTIGIIILTIINILIIRHKS